MTAPVPSDIDGPAGEADGLVEWLRMQEGSAKQNAIEAESRGTQLIAAVWADRAVKLAEAAAAIVQLREQARHYPTVAGENMRLRERLATAERERDEARRLQTMAHAAYDTEFHKRATAETKILALTTAASPLVDWLMKVEAGFSKTDDSFIAGDIRGISITFGDLRRLRTALERAKPAAALPPDKEAQGRVVQPKNVAELDALLNSEDDQPITINPDGSISPDKGAGET